MVESFTLLLAIIEREKSHARFEADSLKHAGIVDQFHWRRFLSAESIHVLPTGLQ